MNFSSVQIDGFTLLMRAISHPAAVRRRRPGWYLIARALLAARLGRLRDGGAGGRALGAAFLYVVLAMFKKGSCEVV